MIGERYGVGVVAVTTIYEFPEKGMFRVELDDGRLWIVRRFGPDRPVERVAGDAAVLRLVELHGIPAERVVPTADGALHDGGVIVTEHVPGRAPTGSLAELVELGDILGRVHAVDGVTRRAGSLPAEDLASARESLTVETPADLVAMLDAISDCEDLPHALVHPDAHLGNTVVTDDGVVLLDWDGAGQGPRIASLGWALFDAATWHSDGPAAVMEGWQRQQSLSAAELDRLHDALLYRPLVHAIRGTPAGARWGDRVRDTDVIVARLRGTLAR